MSNDVFKILNWTGEEKRTPSLLQQLIADDGRKEGCSGVVVLMLSRGLLMPLYIQDAGAAAAFADAYAKNIIIIISLCAFYRVCSLAAAVGCPFVIWTEN